jgi:hypothetical protein
MSRGRGRIQRCLLRILRRTDGYFDTPTLAAMIFGHNPKLTIAEGPSASQLRSVRRALAGLQRDGLAFGTDQQVSE